MDFSLKSIVETFKITHTDSMVQICDTSFRFLFVGNKFAELLGLDPEVIVGKNLSEINCILQPLAANYKELNMPAMSGIGVVNYYTYGIVNQQFRIAHNLVRPIKIENRTIGIIIETQLLVNPLDFGLKYLDTICDKELRIQSVSPNNLPNVLNVEEELMVFLILLGKSDKQIAEILSYLHISLSSSGVTKLIRRRVYPKLQVETRDQLVNKLFYQGMIKLPTLLLQQPQLLRNILLHDRN